MCSTLRFINIAKTRDQSNTPMQKINKCKQNNGNIIIIKYFN